MKLHFLILQLLGYVIYPLWLIAGAFDYWCHRRTHIAATSGATESALHVAQFLTMVVIFGCAVLLRPTMAMVAVITVAALVHLVLSYIDVAYTQPKRHISPLEQHVHGFMDVLPLVAVLLLALLALADPIPDRAFVSRLDSGATRELALLIGSFVILAGGPVTEELIRTATYLRADRRDARSASI